MGGLRLPDIALFHASRFTWFKIQTQVCDTSEGKIEAIEHESWETPRANVGWTYIPDKSPNVEKHDISVTMPDASKCPADCIAPAALGPE